MTFILSLSFCLDIPTDKIITFTTSEKTNVFSYWALVVFFSFGCLAGALNIFLGFKTCYYDNGELIMNQRKIVIKYIKKSFILDILSIYPFVSANAHLLFDGRYTAQWYSMIIFLKMKDIFRFLSKVEDHISLDEKAEASFSLINLIATVLFITHLIACIWCLIAICYSEQDNWTRRLINDNSQLIWSRLYLKAIYWSLTTIVTLGYGDITPQNDLEVAFSLVVMLSGSAIFGYSINKIGVVLENLNRRNRLIM